MRGRYEATDCDASLGTPSTFYPIHLTAGTFDAMGSGFAGVPFVIVGQNRDIAWGSTVNPMDVTDVFAEQLVPDPAAATRQLKLLWLSCGNKDGLIRVSQGVHAYLKEKNVEHVWHVDGNGHDPTHWKNNLWLFSQRIFK